MSRYLGLFLSFYFFLGCAKAFERRGYIVTSPSVFRTNVEHVINVRIFNHEDPVRVNAKLVVQGENVIVSVSADVRISGNLTVKVPPGLHDRASLRICGNCHLSSGFHFQNKTAVTLRHKRSSAFLQTDKPVYKPGQTVHLNVFLVDRDLKPIKENASNDARIIQWRNLKSVCCGVINVSFPLSDQPVLGKWTVYAEVDRSTFNSTFEVQKYVLPKFEVSIIPPPFFRHNCENIEVEAMYVFGKPVEGRLEVNVTVHRVEFSKSNSQYMDISAPILKHMRIRGRKRFPVCLNQLLSEDEHSHFRGYLHIYARVVSEDGAEFTAFDDSTPLSREKVDIDFSFNTRRHFKPELPFEGQILATYLDGSSAGNVESRVSVTANRESVSHQHITSDHNGVANFTVPAVADNTLFMVVKAKIIAVNGRRVGHHGGSITRYLRNWYSPSNCYILAEGPGEPLEVGNEVRISIKSNCPCNFTLFYEILSRGNIVQSGSKRLLSRNQNFYSIRTRAEFRESAVPREMLATESNESVENTYICKSSFPIHVTADMAPTSRMLVYYVKNDGEGVADSISLLVEPELENEIEVVTSTPATLPGSNVTVSVRADPDSCVCLAMVDRSVHVMKPNYRIRKEQIFEELKEYDLNNSPFQDFLTSAIRAKRSGEHMFNPPQSCDAKDAFLESGLVVMTDVVSLNYKETTQVFTQNTLESMTQLIRSESSQTASAKMKKIATKKRTFFPETWIWNCFNMSSSQQNFTFRVPDSVTTWQADAVSLNPRSGIGISSPTRLQSVKKLFVDFNLPYSVIRGEEVEIPLTTYNYLNVCVEASVRVHLPPGVDFVDSVERKMTTRICIEPQTTETVRLNLRFAVLGHKTLRASVQALSHSTRCCGESEESETLVAADRIERKVFVEAEGMKRSYAQSVYFCPNERINISTSSSRSFQFVRLPHNDTFEFDFLVKAPRSVHIILSQHERVTDQSFEIVLGGEGNQRSWISRGSNQILRADIHGSLSEDSFQPFWISWEEGIIQVGTGSIPNVADTKFMFTRQSDEQTRGIRFIGFATSDGATGEFRLWQKEVGNEQNVFKQLISLSLPSNSIQNSARGTASLIGDVMGPTLKNLNNLLSLPFGCGEQNLANFAPNVYVLKYLTGTRQLTEQIRMQTIRYLLIGYQRQLTYKRHDGSYSAFGEKDFAGSMWLTSFVLKSFSQARQFIYIDPKELLEAKEWIVSWQKRNGAFPSVGKIWNKDIQSGVNSDVALTAFVTIALIESGLEREEEQIAVMKAKEYLESTVYEETDSYTASLTAYALTLLDSTFAQDARNRLYNYAIHKKGTTLWSLRQNSESSEVDVFSFAESPLADSLTSESNEDNEPLPSEQFQETDEFSQSDGVEDDSLPPELNFHWADSLKQTVVSAEVEMTGFALLTFTRAKNATVALPIVKWLSQKRNAIGGFSSTQDTCVALQALSEYAVFSFIGGVNLHVNLDCTTDMSENCSQEFDLNNENDKVLQTATIPQLPTDVFVNANGVGCALLQVDVSYNIPEFDGEPAFYIKVDYQETNSAELLPQRRNRPGENGTGSLLPQHSNKYQLEACVRWLNHGSSNMAVLEFHLLTGFEVDLESLEKLLHNNPINLKRYEISGQVILFYFDEVYSTCNSCVRFLASKKFETVTVKPRPVKIYDYYEPSYEFEVMYPEAKESTLSDQSGIMTLNETSDAVTTGDRTSIPSCSCRHDCGFSGPPVCGSNSIVYLNRCRMEAAACELGLEIEERSKEFCERLQPELNEEAIEESTPEEYNEVIIHPPVVQFEQNSDYYTNELPMPEDK